MTAAVVLMLAALWWAVVSESQVTVAPDPPPRHVEYRQFDVGGYLMMNPTVQDSLGRHPVVVLPRGTILMVPVWVGGSSADSLRSGT